MLCAVFGDVCASSSSVLSSLLEMLYGDCVSRERCGGLLVLVRALAHMLVDACVLVCPFLCALVLVGRRSEGR